MRHAKGEKEGYPKTLEEERDKLIQKFGKGIKEIQLDPRVCKGKKSQSRTGNIQQLNTLFVINLQGDLCSISRSVLLWFQ